MEGWGNTGMGGGVGGHEDPRGMRLLSVSVRKEGTGFSEIIG